MATKEIKFNSMVVACLGGGHWVDYPNEDAMFDSQIRILRGCSLSLLLSQNARTNRMIVSL